MTELHIGTMKSLREISHVNVEIVSDVSEAVSIQMIETKDSLRNFEHYLHAETDHLQ
jgi:hypothetical protein